MGPEREGGDNTEVAASPAQRPEQLRVLVGARRDHLAGREHHLRLDELVEGEAEFAHHPAEAAAEGEAAHADRRGVARAEGECVVAERLGDRAPRRSPAHAHEVAVHLDRHEQSEVDHHAAVVCAVPDAAVPAATHRQREPVVAREAHRTRHTVGARRLHDDRRRSGARVDGARPFVALVAGHQHPFVAQGLEFEDRHQYLLASLRFFSPAPAAVKRAGATGRIDAWTVCPKPSSP
jgi:hypothetical protein